MNYVIIIENLKRILATRKTITEAIDIANTLKNRYPGATITILYQD